jgi:DNA-directed RNA polymerase specialized sigma54-like protein
MGITMIDAVLSKSQASGTTRLIAVILARTADDHGYTYRSVRTIAEQAGVDERTAQRNIRKLVELHELRVSMGTGPRGCNEYWLVWGAISSSDAPPRMESSPCQSATPDDSHPWQIRPETPGNW